MSLPETFFDFFGEFIIEVFFKHLLHPCFKHIGTAIKWPFLFMSYTYREIYEQRYNVAIGITFLSVALIITLGVAIYAHQ